MRELSKAEQLVLDTIDAEIGKIDEKLEPFQTLIERKNRLVKTKATLLNERATGGGGAGRSGVSLSAEQVQQAFAQSESRYMTVAEIASATGVADSTVRSHLHRKKDVAYKQKGDRWRMIGDKKEEE